jgi:glutamate synthase domain-containing protein 2
MKKKIAIYDWNKLEDHKPAYALVGKTDLVIIRYDDQVSVLFGRCLHRGALLADGYIEGHNLICGVHFWDYRYNEEVLHKFTAVVENGKVWIDEREVEEFEQTDPIAIHRDEYPGTYAATHPTPEEPKMDEIHRLARHGLEKDGHHGPVAAMGVTKWDDIQILPAQLARQPHLEEVEVGTELVIGPNAEKPLKLKIPIFVSDMSFGALSEEAKIILARGAEMAGTGTCSGEGGMLPEEQQENNRYFYELASAKFGYSMDLVEKGTSISF